MSRVEIVQRRARRIIVGVFVAVAIGGIVLGPFPVFFGFCCGVLVAVAIVARDEAARGVQNHG